jgi:hypothetical protein
MKKNGTKRNDEFPIAPKERRSYHFDLGNSSKGCLGLCARVVATSKREAVRLLKESFEHTFPLYASVERDGQYQGTVALELKSAAIDYVHVYLNFDNLDTRHISPEQEQP